MTADLISIKINSWKKHNGRSDVMKNSWFKLNNRIFEDPIMYSLPPEHFKTWIFLLCVASQQSNGHILMNLDLAEKILCVKKSEILRCVKYLASQKIIDVTHALRARDADVPLELELELEKKYLVHRADERVVDEIGGSGKVTKADLEGAYSLYPRKQGKSEGLRRLVKEIKTSDDLSKLTTAIKNYVACCEREKREPKHIKIFSSFVSSWTDWVDPETGTSQDFSDNGKTKQKTISFIAGIAKG